MAQPTKGEKAARKLADEDDAIEVIKVSEGQVI